MIWFILVHNKIYDCNGEKVSKSQLHVGLKNEKIIVKRR